MWLYYFLIVYILVLAISLGVNTQNSFKKKAYIFLTFGLFTIMASLRSENVGNDTIVYISLFKSILVMDDLTAFVGRYEIGYLYLNKLLSLIFSNPQIILIVTSFFTMFGFATFINKYSKVTWLSVYLFFTLRFFDTTMNVIRLNIAIVLILFAYDFLRQKKLFNFILIVIAAFLFHRTAIVFLLAWPITKLKFNYKTVTFIIISSLLLYIGFSSILYTMFKIFPTYQYYLDSVYLDGEIRLASVMNILVGISIILLGVSAKYYKKNNLISNNIVKITPNFLDEEKEAINDGENMLLLLIVGVAFTFLSFKFNLLGRVGSYFLVFSIVYLPNSINQLKNKKLVAVIIFIVVVLFFAYATCIQIIRPEWNRIYPYTFFWL